MNFIKESWGLWVAVFLGIMLGQLFTTNNGFTTANKVKAEQPKSVKIVYEVGYLQVYCEQPTGNTLYTITHPINGGVGIFVVPGGCK